MRKCFDPAASAPGPNSSTNGFLYLWPSNHIEMKLKFSYKYLTLIPPFLPNHHPKGLWNETCAQWCVTRMGQEVFFPPFVHRCDGLTCINNSLLLRWRVWSLVQRWNIDITTLSTCKLFYILLVPAWNIMIYIWRAESSRRRHRTDGKECGGPKRTGTKRKTNKRETNSFMRRSLSAANRFHRDYTFSWFIGDWIGIKYLRYFYEKYILNNPKWMFF